MRQLDVALSAGALSDLQQIAFYVYERSGNVVVARAYDARIPDVCARIGDAPQGGRPREDLGPGVRSWSFERRATILYRVTADRVVVLRIVHRGRPIMSKMVRDD